MLERLFVDRMDQNEDIFVRFMNDVPFQKVVTSWMAEEAYRRLRVSEGSAMSAPRSRLRLVEGAAKDRYVKCVPSCRSRRQRVRSATHSTLPTTTSEWVEVDSERRLRPGMFVAGCRPLDGARH